MSNKSQSNESPVEELKSESAKQRWELFHKAIAWAILKIGGSTMKELRMAELQRISRIIMELEPLAHIYEKHGTELFKVCFELLAEFRSLEKSLVENPQRALKLNDIYRRTFTGTFLGDRKALLKMVPDHDS